MTTVFIGGSRRVSRVSSDVRKRIDRMISKQLPMVLGDANGADKAVQRYLQELGYPHVEVFCSDPMPRNNLGGWPTRVIRPTHARRDFDYYATKDRAMAAEATVALMLWDGQSRGTLMNILRLVGLNKPTVVYVGAKKSFLDVRTSSDFDLLVADLDRPTLRQLHAQAADESRINAGPAGGVLRYDPNAWYRPQVALVSATSRVDAHEWASGRRVIVRGNALFWTVGIVAPAVVDPVRPWLLNRRPGMAQGRAFDESETAFWRGLSREVRAELTYQPSPDVRSVRFSRGSACGSRGRVAHLGDSWRPGPHRPAGSRTKRLDES